MVQSLIQNPQDGAASASYPFNFCNARKMVTTASQTWLHYLKFDAAISTLQTGTELPQDLRVERQTPYSDSFEWMLDCHVGASVPLVCKLVSHNNTSMQLVAILCSIRFVADSVLSYHPDLLVPLLQKIRYGSQLVHVSVIWKSTNLIHVNDHSASSNCRRSYMCCSRTRAHQLTLSTLHDTVA